MKKTLVFVASMFVAAILFLSPAKAEFKLGGVVNFAAYYANVKETLKDSGHISEKEAIAGFEYGTIFAEFSSDAAMGIGVGVEYSPGAIELSDERRTLVDNVNSTEDDGEQVADASFEDLIHVYLTIPIFDTGGYIKAGASRVELLTKETLTTGSKYNDTTVDGVSLGVGVEYDLADMVFVRLEGMYTDWDDVKLSGTEEGGTSGSYNNIEAEMGGVAARAAIGFQF